MHEAGEWTSWIAHKMQPPFLLSGVNQQHAALLQAEAIPSGLLGDSDAAAVSGYSVQRRVCCWDHQPSSDNAAAALPKNRILCLIWISHLKQEQNSSESSAICFPLRLGHKQQDENIFPVLDLWPELPPAASSLTSSAINIHDINWAAVGCKVVRICCGGFNLYTYEEHLYFTRHWLNKDIEIKYICIFF